MTKFKKNVKNVVTSMVEGSLAVCITQLTYLELYLELGVEFLESLECLLCVTVPCALNADLMTMILLQVLNVLVQVLRYSTHASTNTNTQ